MGASNYREAIDKALDNTSIVVAVGTSLENLDSGWVQHEWGSFYNDIMSGLKPKGKVFTYIEGLLPSQLPRSLRQTETFMHSPESLQHLYGFVARALGQGRPEPAISPLPLEAVPSLEPSPVTFRGSVANALGQGHPEPAISQLPLEAAPSAEPSPVDVRDPRLDVFLSYAPEDREYAKAVKVAIEAAGVYGFNLGVSEEVTESILTEYLRQQGGQVNRSFAWWG